MGFFTCPEGDVPGDFYPMISLNGERSMVISSNSTKTVPGKH